MPIEKATAIHASRLAEVRTQLDTLAQTWPHRITLEIGCGHGHFLTAYAQAHPDEYCLGLDIIADRILRAQKKAHRAGLTNLAFLHAEAALLLDALPADWELQHIFVLFPDPWPKRRHHKNRLMQPDFLQKLAAKTAGQGARLNFRTDYEPYYKDAMAVLQMHAKWEGTDEPWPFEFETVFQSRADTFHSCVAKPVPAPHK